jgi:DNA-binding response OmpR family regulator
MQYASTMRSRPDSEKPLSSQPSLRVLLLEDDELLRDHVLVPNLLQFGFDVAAIGHPADLNQQIQQRPPDIVVLDVGLPDSDGFQVARQLRARIASIGIIMLTARAETTDRIRGLSEGADAYLSKPIDIDLLAATLYSLARRLRTTPHPVAGHWHLDANGWCLLSPVGGVVALTQSESRLLAPLMESANEVMSRDALIEKFAEEGIDFDSQRLDVLIHRLRKKVLQVLGVPLPLNAVHGKGYVLVSRQG